MEHEAASGGCRIVGGTLGMVFRVKRCGPSAPRLAERIRGVAQRNRSAGNLRVSLAQEPGEGLQYAR